MSATVESPMSCRRVLRLPDGLLRSMSSQTALSMSTKKLAATTNGGSSPECGGGRVAMDVVDGPEWNREDCNQWNGNSSPSDSAELRQVSSAKVVSGGFVSGLYGSVGRSGGRVVTSCRPTGSGLSTQFNKFCSHVRSNVNEFHFTVALPGCLSSSSRHQHHNGIGKALSHSTDGLADLRVTDPPRSPLVLRTVASRLRRQPVGDHRDQTSNDLVDHPSSSSSDTPHTTSLSSASPSSSPSSSPSPPSSPPTLCQSSVETQHHQPPPCAVVVPGVPCGLVAEALSDTCALSAGLLLVLDCRTFVAYNANHVRGALNVSCSDCISRKRLLAGRTTLGDLVSGADDAKERYRQAVDAVRGPGDKTAVQVIVYDDDTVDFGELSSTSSVRLVVSCLLKDGFVVYYMLGGLKAFQKDYSSLCTQSGLPLTRLSVSCPSPSSEGRVDDAKISMILPFLFIGNEQDAADRNLLNQLGIAHILNVTSHVPLHFESDGIKYRRLSAVDNSNQNLRQYFDDAIRFIDEVYSNGGRVMIHCQAGVSRSSTITIAYVMARSQLGMLDAFRFVKSRRPIVAPNFNFMGQLLDFETALARGLVTRHPQRDVIGFITDCQAQQQQQQQQLQQQQNGHRCDDVMTTE
jgi:dual specificity MAP kinase phosphatase